MRKLSKASLSVFLASLKGFSSPKVSVEQYLTEPDIAADTLWKAYMAGDIEGKVIADLGCGTGILGIGALILGAKKVYMIDSDQEALNIAQTNLDMAKSEGLYEGEAIILNQDIKEFRESVDTAVENPPFGVQVRHADREFLIKALEIASVTYTIHKSESKGFIDAFCRDNQAIIETVWDFNMPLKKTMKFHSKRVRHINVSLWKIRKMSPQAL